MRIVYDASAQSNGPSLNDCLYTGPSFGQSILDILLRFCVHTDIEKEFLMISVAEEDKDIFQFLWIDDISKAVPEVLTLRFKQVMFGVSSLALFFLMPQSDITLNSIRTLIYYLLKNSFNLSMLMMLHMDQVMLKRLINSTLVPRADWLREDST